MRDAMRILLWCDTEFRPGQAQTPWQAGAVAQRADGSCITVYDRGRTRGVPLSAAQIAEFQQTLHAFSQGRRAGLVCCWGVPERWHIQQAGVCMDDYADVLAGFRTLFPQVSPSAEESPMSFAMDVLRQVFGFSAEFAHQAVQDCRDTSAIVLLLLRATIRHCEQHGVEL